MPNPQFMALLGAAGSDGAQELGLPLDPDDRKGVIDQLRALTERMGQMGDMRPSEGSLMRPEGLGGVAGPMTAPQQDLASTPILALLELLQGASDEQVDSILGRKRERLRGRTAAVGALNPVAPGDANAGGLQGQGGFGGLGDGGGFGDVSPP